MNNKETLQSYNTRLGENNVTLDDVLNTIDELPDVEGSLEITENGTYDVKQYAEAVVNTPEPSKYAPRFISFRDYSGTELNNELANLDTTNIKNMSYMFNNCTKATTLDVSNFDTSNVTNMSYMFYSCYAITALNLSHFNTSKVQLMSYMFHSCLNLNQLDVSNFDTSNVTNMSNLFTNCSALTELNLSNFNISKVTSMGYMFSGCSNLTKLDIRNFDFSNVSYYTSMFRNVPDNCEIIVKDDTAKTWLTSKFTNLTNVKTVAEL